jgi:hypothetical protein
MKHSSASLHYRLSTTVCPPSGRYSTYSPDLLKKLKSIVGGLHHPLRCLTRVILQVAIPSPQVLSYKGRGLTAPAPPCAYFCADFL